MQKAEKTDIYQKEQTLLERNKSIFRFVIVGIINTTVDFLIFTFFQGFLETDKLLSQIFGYCGGVANSFVLNKLWTFDNGSSKLGTGAQMLRFICINLLSLSISLLGLRVLNDYYSLNVYTSKVFVTGIAQLINYAGYKIWVFGGK